MTASRSKLERLKSLIEGFSSGLLVGTIVMVGVLFQSLRLPIQRELSAVLLATLCCSIVILASSIRKALSKKEE
jgi:hypothetical protein